MIYINLKNRAISQNTLPFNSMCKFGDAYLGCTDAGLFAIGGYNDNGAEIPMLMRSGTTDFGMGNQKRFRSVTVGGEANGNCKFSLYADGVLAAELDIVPDADGQFSETAYVSRAAQGRFWYWQIENVDGAFVAVYNITALPIVLHPGRRVG